MKPQTIIDSQKSVKIDHIFNNGFIMLSNLSNKNRQVNKMQLFHCDDLQILSANITPLYPNSMGFFHC